MAVVAEDGVDISDTNLGGHSAPGILHHQDLQIRGILYSYLWNKSGHTPKHKWNTQAFQVKEEIIEVSDEAAELKSSPPPAPGPAATKSKKKPEKKSKEKDSFKHPWLITSLKVHTDLTSICLRIVSGSQWACYGPWYQSQWKTFGHLCGGPDRYGLEHQVNFLEETQFDMKSHSPLHLTVSMFCREFSAREHKPLRCNVEFDHGLFVK